MKVSPPLWIEHSTVWLGADRSGRVPSASQRQRCGNGASRNITAVVNARDAAVTFRESIWQATEALTPPRHRLWLNYLRAHRKFPNYKKPLTFNEKVLWRMRFDRRPLIGHTCDKLWTKEYGIGCGIESPETLWDGTDIAAIPTLEGDWVMKPNHQSGKVLFGSGLPNREEISAVWSAWLKPYARGTELGQWAYTQARPSIFFERRLGPVGTDVPDYKIYVFGGRVAMIQVVGTKFTDHWRTCYTPDWTLIEQENLGRQVHGTTGASSPPAELDALVQAASRVGSEFDFIRADFYVVDGAVYLGELTPYPDSGLRRFWSDSLDKDLGRQWTLPSLPIL